MAQHSGVETMNHLESVFGVPHPVALVTGSGAPRIGNCLVRVLAERGYRIVVHSHLAREQAQSTVKQLSAKTEAIGVTADLRREEAVEKMFAQTISHFGRLDALVNCAAIWDAKPLEKVTATDVQQHFEINTLGTFLCCQQAGMQMVGQKFGGAIVNLGDWAVVRPYMDHAAYFSSKGAIPAMTRSFAVELSQRNPRIRVNAVLPGPVMLPPELPESARQEAIEGTLVRREGAPEHVAHAVEFLLENDFVTGVCLPVDGGRSVFAPQRLAP